MSLPPSWRDHQDRAVSRTDPPGVDSAPFYEGIGEFQGELYDRNVFTSGTAAEVDVLVEVLGLAEGDRVLDLGCGTGRHLRMLGDRGIGGMGLDASSELIAAARKQFTSEVGRAAAARLDREVGLAAAARHTSDVFFEVADVRQPLQLADFDAAVCLCHGGLGTGVAGDAEVVGNLGRSVRPGGRVAFTVFHALFAARHLAPGDAFDPMTLTHHQPAEVHGADGERRTFDLWTSAYTVPGAVRLASDAGLEVLSVVGVEPGRYRPVDAQWPVRLDDPELLVTGLRTA